MPQITRRQLFFENKLHSRLPDCKRFVAKFWEVPEEKVEPSLLLSENGNGHRGRTIARAFASRGREVLFYVDAFNNWDHSSKSIDGVLVHELTHLATIPPLRGENTIVAKCLSEGLASYAQQYYYHTRLPLWRKIVMNLGYNFEESARESIHYLSKQHEDGARGKSERLKEQDINPYAVGSRFVWSLHHAGLTPPQMLRALSAEPPKIDELFMPLDYLQRTRIPFRIRADCGIPNVKAWVDEAVLKGLKRRRGRESQSADISEFMAPTPIINCGKFLLGFTLSALLLIPGSLLVFFHTVYDHVKNNSPKPKGAPHSLLASPSSYGARFVNAVLDLAGTDGARLMRECPPESISDIMDPASYLGNVRSHWHSHRIENMRRQLRCQKSE